MFDESVHTPWTSLSLGALRVQVQSLGLSLQALQLLPPREVGWLVPHLILGTWQKVFTLHDFVD